MINVITDVDRVTSAVTDADGVQGVITDVDGVITEKCQFGMSIAL